MAQPQGQSTVEKSGPRTRFRTPRIQVTLYKSIMRKFGEAGLPSSERYANKDAGIDLTPFLGDGASVTVSKSCKQISGGFTITFRDMPNSSFAPAESIMKSAQPFTMESVYGLIEPMLDVGFWNELFIESREDGEYLVWRPLPYFDLMSGTMTQPLLPDQYGSKWSLSGSRALPAIVTVPDNKIISIRQTRTDRDVYNFYWCNNQRFDMIDDMTRRLQTMMADGHKTTLEYPNTNVEIYGVRLLQANTVMGYPDLDNMTSGADQTEQDERGGLVAEWIKYRRNVIILNNRDNAVLEKGVIEMAGGLPKALAPELMRPGDYLQVTQGSTAWLAYVVNLQETFMPYRGFTATVEFERGTGFAERVSYNGSPWLAEQATGGNFVGGDNGLGGRGRLAEDMPDPGLVCPAPYPQNKQRRNPSSEQSMVNSLMDELSKIPGIDNSTKK
ncbi:hypothetical protein ZL54_22440 [Salmonella enterica subsp. enterica]|nr:hypothetical protein [Salmonella enterica subsp. enterica]EEJ7209097.1 hypothetical protein [Salmonella enterica subsp. enterica]